MQGNWQQYEQSHQAVSEDLVVLGERFVVHEASACLKFSSSNQEKISFLI
jgi:hypothetical protein